MFKENAFSAVKLIIDQIYNKLAEHVCDKYYIFLISRTIKKDSLSLLKKLLIFLREKG
jgi:hypothetical protein